MDLVSSEPSKSFEGWIYRFLGHNKPGGKGSKSMRINISDWVPNKFARQRSSYEIMLARTVKHHLASPLCTCINRTPNFLRHLLVKERNTKLLTCEPARSVKISRA